MAAKRTPHIGRLTPESYFTNLDEKNRGSSQSNSVLSLVTHREKEREIAQMSLSLRTLPSFSSNLGRDEFSERDKKKLSFHPIAGVADVRQQQQNCMDLAHKAEEEMPLPKVCLKCIHFSAPLDLPD
jgi:hypothetical protein